MARYTVHVPVQPETRSEALERAVFVRDGWNWAAFAFGPFWLLWHRHWVMGVLTLLGFAALITGLNMLRLPESANGAATTLLSLLWGLEGASLRRLALARAGYAEEGLVVGSNIDALEQRYFAETGEIAAAPSPSRPPDAALGLWAQPVIGLFPDARKHP
jgi:Protein of unknown function (DUF2628)